MSSASIWVTRGEQQWWRIVVAVAAVAMVAAGMITVLPLTASATSAGSADDTAGVFLYNAGSDTQGFITPPPGPCAGIDATDPTNETVQIAVDTGSVLYFIGDEPSEVVAFTLGAEGERVGGQPDAAIADVNVGLRAIDDYGFVGNASGASDDESNYDAQTSGDVTLQLDVDGTYAAPGGTDIAIIVPDGVTSTGVLENNPADPFGNLDGAEIFIFEDAETSGMLIELFGPGLAGPYPIDIVDYQRNPDTIGAADDTLIAIDLDSLPGFTFPYVEQIKITDDGTPVSPNISTCPNGGLLDTSVELDAVATRTDAVLAGPPAIDIEKATNGIDADIVTGPQILVGQPVNWTYVVTNTGEAPLANVTVTDDQGVAVDCGNGTNVLATDLPPGGVATCAGVGTASAGQYFNNSTVVGTPRAPEGALVPNANVTDADPSHYIGVAPAVDIEKDTNGVQSDAAPGETLQFGSTVTWTYVVTNTGTAVLSNLSVTDSDPTLAVACGAGGNVITQLAPGASATCTASGAAILGQYANTSTVVATPVDGAGTPLPGGNISDADPSHYVGTANAAIDIEKATNGFQADNPPGQAIPVGNPVTWTYVVTNTGTTYLVNAVVTDSDPAVTVTCAGFPAILAPGASASCTATGTATFGQYSNTGSVVADPATAAGAVIAGLAPVNDADLSHYNGSASASVDIEKDTNGFQADNAPGQTYVVGEAITWTYVVTNTGTTHLVNLVVADDDPAVSVSCPAGSLAGPLAPGASITCTATGTAVAGQYANNSTVVGTPATAAGAIIAGLAPVNDADPSHYRGAAPAIQLEKATNGADADVPTGPSISVGDTVTWRYSVTNIGQVTLTTVTVVDNLVPAADINCGDGTNVIASMPPGSVVDCFATGIATFGQYANTSDVTGQPVNAAGAPVGPAVTDTDPSHYIGTANPSVAIEKATNTVDADVPTGPTVVAGDIVTWDYVVTNTGTTNLINLLVADNDPTVSVDCGGSNVEPGPIAPGASFACTATGPAIAGQYANTGSVTGTPADSNGAAIVGLQNVVADDPSHYLGLVPSIDLEKATNGQDADTPAGPQLAPGDTVTWTYVVTNTSQVTLSQVTLADNMGVTVVCPSGTNVVATLAPGATATCTGTGTAVLGQYVNVGAVTAQPVDAAGAPVGGPVADSDPSHYFGIAAPAIDIEKDTNGIQADTGTGPSIAVGDTVTWTYVVTNTGNTPLSTVTVTDTDLLAAVDCGGGSNVVAGPVLPGGTFTCTATGTATAGQYNNGSSVVGAPTDAAGVALVDPTGAAVGPVQDDDPSAYFGVAPAMTLVKAVNSADANTAPGINVPVGSTLSWTFVVTNTGNVALTALTVSDPALTGVDCGGGSATVATLAPGASYTCTATSIAAAGQVLNTADLTATPEGPDGTSFAAFTVTDPANYFGGDASIDLEKATNGIDADVATGPVLAVGDAVTWTFVVTNTGTVDLANVAVADDLVATVTCAAGNPIPLLAVGATETCTATGTATAGQYTNVGTAVGTPTDGGDPVTDTDPSNYLGAAPAVTIEKDTNGIQADAGTGPYIAVGDAVTWTYVVTNTGNVTLDPIVVTDDQGVAVTCAAGSLAPGAATTCTAAGVATADQYNNIGAVAGTAVDGAGAPIAGLAPVTADDPSAYFGALAAIDIETDTNGIQADTGTGPLLGVGDPVTWTYVITNTGNVDLSLVTVVDDQGVTLDCGTGNVVAMLAPGDSFTCTAPGVASLGQYNNIGAVIGNPVDPAGNPIAGLAPVTDDDPTAHFGLAEPNIDIVKFVNDADANDAASAPSVLAGSAVEWTYVVTNTGDVDLANVTVVDDQGVTVACPSGTNVIALLPVGQNRTCTAAGTAIVGAYVNIGDVVGDPVDAAGAAVLDAAGVALPSPTDADPANYFGGDSAIDIEKATNGDQADIAPGPSLLVGDDVTWTYVVTNTGNLDLVNIAVTDDVVAAADIDCGTGTNVIASLPVGAAAVTCTATGVAVDGQYANTGSAAGSDVNGAAVLDTDPSHYIAVAPAVTLEKATNGIDADVVTGPNVPVGSTVTWTYVVTNTGTAELTAVTVTDDIVAATGIDCGGATNVVASLAVGESVTCTATGTAIAGQYANVGTVTAAPVDAAGAAIGAPLTETDPSHYFGGEPGLTLEKATNTVDADAAPGPVVAVGDTISWTYVVTNNGNVTITDITVIDDVVAAADISCAGGTNVIAALAAGASATCTATGTAVAGQYANIGTAEGQPVDAAGNPVGAPQLATDLSHYFAAAPAVTIVKDTNGADGLSVLVGEAVEWTYLVTNTGNVALDPIVVTDDQGEAVTCPVALLAPAATTTCTATGVAALGDYSNVGTVTGTPVMPNGDPVPGGAITAADPSSYTGTAVPLFNLGDYVWIDLNADGVQDAGEEALAGVTLILTDAAGATQTAVTDAAGLYLFTGLADGTYTVTVDLATLPAGYAATFDADGGLDNTSTIALGGADNLAQDFGYVPPPSVTLVKKTNDTPANTAPGVTIQVGETVTWTYEVTNSGPVVLTAITVTDNQIADSEIDCAAGSNVIASLAPGATVICTATGIATLGAYENIGTASGTDPLGTTVADTDPSNYVGTPEPLGNIGNYVWLDANRDGIQQASEVGLAGITVTLVAPDGSTTTTVTGSNGEYLFAGLPAGDYTVIVSKGAGFPAGAVQTFDASGDQLDHTSTLTLAAGADDLAQDFGYAFPNASIGDTVWFDANRNGILDDGEAGIEGITVLLIDADGNETTVVTAADGTYIFDGLAAGTYTVSVSKADGFPAGAVQTFDAAGDQLDHTSTVTIVDGEANVDQDFGYALPDGVIGDLVWLDANNNGVFDAGEGVAGITITLLDANGDTQTTVTDGDGLYLFTGLPGGDYLVTVDKTAELAAQIRLADLDAVLDNSTTITLAEGGSALDADFAYLPSASLGDFVFLDANGNGVQDAGEAGIEGVVVNLFETDENGVVTGAAIASEITDADGMYSFTGLDPRLSYTIQVIPAPGFVLTARDAGDDDALDSEINPATGFTSVITLTPGENSTTFDAGIVALEDGISLEKSVSTVRTGVSDADTVATGPTLVQGEAVTWTYVVTNTGGTNLVNVAVTDDIEGAITCPQATLAVGASMTCTATGTVNVVAGQPGVYTNVGTAVGTPAADDGTVLAGRTAVSDTDAANYTGVISLTVTAPTPTPVPATAVPVQPTPVVVVVVATATPAPVVTGPAVPDPKSIAILFQGQSPDAVLNNTGTTGGGSQTPLALTGRNSTDFALVAAALIVSGAAFVALGRRRENEAEA